MKPDDELPEDALAAVIEGLMPKDDGDGDAWSISELRRLALMGRVTGDLSAAVSAHRALMDALGALRGEYGKKRQADHDMTDEDAEAAILEAAAHIAAKRKVAKGRKS